MINKVKKEFKKRSTHRLVLKFHTWKLSPVKNDRSMRLNYFDKSFWDYIHFLFRKLRNNFFFYKILIIKHSKT